jgi:hypothetical protein
VSVLYVPATPAVLAAVDAKMPRRTPSAFERVVPSGELARFVGAVEILNCDVAGAVVGFTATVKVSVPATNDGIVNETGTNVSFPARAAPIVPMVIADGVVTAAEAGVTDVKTPKPKAATATSAMRLKVVFVDICFLSISRSREFPSFGFELIS